MLRVTGKLIRMTRGDSELLTLHIIRQTMFTERDRAVFTIGDGRKAIFAHVSRLDVPLPEFVDAPCAVDRNGWIQVPLPHSVTAGWRAGIYAWDVRIVLDATVDEDGNVTGGREIHTPMSAGSFMLDEAVGQIE